MSTLDKISAYLTQEIVDRDNTIRGLRDEVTRLKAGGCRFDCRAQRRRTFLAGYTAGAGASGAYPDEEKAEAAFERDRASNCKATRRRFSRR